MKIKLPFLLWLLLIAISIQLKAQNNDSMYVHYINVGQAASELLEFSCGAILIDAGAQDASYHQKLMDYLTRFFTRRKDLNNTLALVMITHPHIDHNEVLKDIARKFKIARYVDDGLRTGSGKVNQIWMEDSTKVASIPYESFSYETISAAGNKQGLTDDIIAPLNCSNGNPKIILYSGQFEKQPSDWTATDFKNMNNHSLVIKVIFGKASFLFTGDLELKGLNTLVNTYRNTQALHADILMIGHHGAANATTEYYLKAVNPSYAVISCGEWDYGKGGTNKFTTYYYGHPRISTIQMLEEYISINRKHILTEEAAEGSQDFRLINIDKAIYATPWDQTIVILATTNANYTFSSNN